MLHQLNNINSLIPNTKESYSRNRNAETHLSSHHLMYLAKSKGHNGHGGECGFSSSVEKKKSVFRSVMKVKRNIEGEVPQATIDALSYSGLLTLGLNYSHLAGALTCGDAAVASPVHTARPCACPLGSALFF